MFSYFSQPKLLDFNLNRKLIMLDCFNYDSIKLNFRISSVFMLVIAKFCRVFGAILSILMLFGCDKKPDQQGTGQIPPPTVGVVIVEAVQFAQSTQLPGRTSSLRSAEVRPQVNGIILKRFFTEGSEVKEGEQLYQIDPAIYQAQYASSRANLQSAESLYKRYKELIGSRAISQQQFEQAESSYLSAKAAFDLAAINLRYTKVLAPISGRIGRSAITEGALVSVGQPQALAVINQLDPINVDVVQSSKDVLRLRNDLALGKLQQIDGNAKVRLKLEDGSIYAHEGSLQLSEVSVDESTGTIVLRAQFPNPDKILLPGMFVHAQLVEGVKENAILVPQQGVSRDPRGNAIAMVVNTANTVEARSIVAERTVDNRWLVLEGLQVGDRVITEGLQFIRPGTVVNPVPAGNVAH